MTKQKDGLITTENEQNLPAQTSNNLTNVIKDGDDEFIQVITSVDDFSFAKLDKQGDRVKGFYIGLYNDVCARMNTKPNNKVKGHVIMTQNGLQIVSNFHSLDSQLSKIIEGQEILIIRGENVYKENAENVTPQTKPKYVHFSVAVKK
jgi:hypothetical protein